MKPIFTQLFMLGFFSLVCSQNTQAYDRNFDTLYVNAKQVLKKAANEAFQYRSEYEAMLNACFSDSGYGIFENDPPGSRLQICFESGTPGGAYGHYDRSLHKALICERTYSLRIEEAVTVPIHECAHHLYGPNEGWPNQLGEGAMRIANDMGLHW